mmetsp:Transcript_13158/g.38701  ORF Transcript_13158/g.38701 Transcript_13158/m.38701 type:complete len:343 (+) Transcript_13158:15-1043(+)
MPTHHIALLCLSALKYAAASELSQAGDFLSMQVNRSQAFLAPFTVIADSEGPYTLSTQHRDAVPLFKALPPSGGELDIPQGVLSELVDLVRRADLGENDVFYLRCASTMNMECHAYSSFGVRNIRKTSLVDYGLFYHQHSLFASRPFTVANGFRFKVFESPRPFQAQVHAHGLQSIENLTACEVLLQQAMVGHSSVENIQDVATILTIHECVAHAGFKIMPSSGYRPSVSYTDLDVGFPQTINTVGWQHPEPQTQPTNALHNCPPRVVTWTVNVWTDTNPACRRHATEGSNGTMAAPSTPTNANVHGPRSLFDLTVFSKYFLLAEGDGRRIFSIRNAAHAGT